MSSAVEYVVEHAQAYEPFSWVIMLDGAVIDTFLTEDQARERCAEYNAEAQ
jgi:hypothetical protein